MNRPWMDQLLMVYYCCNWIFLFWEVFFKSFFFVLFTQDWICTYCSRNRRTIRVTRLGLETSVPALLVQIFGNVLAVVKMSLFKKKYWWLNFGQLWKEMGYFGKKIRYFLFQHLVTLQTQCKRIEKLFFSNSKLNQNRFKKFKA